MQLNEWQLLILIIFGLLYFRQKTNMIKIKNLRAETEQAVREFLEGFIPAALIMFFMATSQWMPMLLVIAVEMAYHAVMDKELANARAAALVASTSFIFHGVGCMLVYGLVQILG